MTASATVARIDALLTQDPRIGAFSLAGGEAGLEVNGTAEAGWFAEERRTSREAMRRRILRQWRYIYDRSYHWDREVRPPNFDVWVSGFTNAPIPLPQMQVWLDACLTQLRRVAHGRVLDIGCGVGLVLAGLAPGGVSYEGIDLSEEAIASLGAWVATQDDLGHVALVQAAAHELSARDGAPVDLAVLNSVAQYFPDSDYLTKVLQAAVDQIAPGGSIYVGDLRASALLPMRALNVAAAQAAPGATAGEVRAEAAQSLAASRELAIDPGFFQTLGAALPRLGHVRFVLKPAATDHDLSGYRYDALLRLDRPEAPPAPAMEAASLDAVRGLLAADRPGALAVLGLANARLARDAALARRLQEAAADRLVVELIQEMEPLQDPGIEPDDLTRAATALGYAAELRFTPGAEDGRFDALLLREGTEARWPDGPVPHPVANDPVGTEVIENLRRSLHTAIEAAADGAPLARLELKPPAVAKMAS